MKFTKMHGLGNDYIYVNGMTEHIRDPVSTARILSDRHKGVGADGLIVINASQKADFRMQMYNADGSVGEMCGNGIRCLAKYVYEHRMTDQTNLAIETNAGIRNLELAVEAGEVRMVRVSMGSPILLAEKIPVISEHTIVIDEAISICHMEYHMTCVSVGNPHAVVFVRNVNGIDMGLVGPEFEYNGRFPRRINAEFVEIIDRNTIKMRVWERGAGETLACGTGACAAVCASVLNDLTDRKVTVKLIGGDLTIEWMETENQIYMTGPATHVFDGEIEIDTKVDKLNSY